jgi:RNA recognition motif-containing protein
MSKTNMSEVFIFGLPPDTTDFHLYRIFATFGQISPRGCTAVLDADTGLCKGFGFINFLAVESANLAITSLHGFVIPDGNALRVEAKRQGVEQRNDSACDERPASTKQNSDLPAASGTAEETPVEQDARAADAASSAGHSDRTSAESAGSSACGELGSSAVQQQQHLLQQKALEMGLLPTVPSKRLYIGGLPTELTSDKAITIFAQYCRIDKCTVIQAMPGTAFLITGSVEDAQWIVDNLVGNIPSGLAEPIGVVFATQKG